jgi:hypothetical protein
MTYIKKYEKSCSLLFPPRASLNCQAQITTCFCRMRRMSYGKTTSLRVRLTNLEIALVLRFIMQARNIRPLAEGVGRAPISDDGAFFNRCRQLLRSHFQ